MQRPGPCLCDCPSTTVETAIAQCTSRWAMARGHRLDTSIVLAAVHGLFGLFRAVSTVEPSVFRPLPPPVPVPNKHPRFCGRKAKSLVFIFRPVQMVSNPSKFQALVYDILSQRCWKAMLGVCNPSSVGSHCVLFTGNNSVVIVIFHCKHSRR